MILCLDIGNSSIKTGLFDGSTLVRTSRLSAGGRDGIHQVLQGVAIERVGICSVVPRKTAALVSALGPRCPAPPVIVSHQLRLPFEMAYATPETLGADRIAAASGARSLFPDAGSLVTVDAGSAVTIEVVTGGRFLGGAIAPGPELLHRSLAQNTAQLPALTADIPARSIGRSTEESIRSGVTSIFVEGVRGLLLRTFDEMGEEATVVACGGWGAALAERIPEIDHFEPHLVLHGVRALVEANRE